MKTNVQENQALKLANPERLKQAPVEGVVRVWRGCGDSIEGYLSSAKIHTAEVSRDRCELEDARAPDHVLQNSVLSRHKGGLEQQRNPP